MNLIAIRWLDLDSKLSIVVADMDVDEARSYAVIDGFGQCLNVDGIWEHEPMPSNRDDAFKARCRFKDFADAAAMLESAASR